MADDKLAVKEEGWDYEILSRHGRWILLVYRDGQTIGSLELNERSDKDLWQKIMDQINNPLFMQETE